MQFKFGTKIFIYFVIHRNYIIYILKNLTVVLSLKKKKEKKFCKFCCLYANMVGKLIYKLAGYENLIK